MNNDCKQFGEQEKWRLGLRVNAHISECKRGNTPTVTFSLTALMEISLHWTPRGANTLCVVTSVCILHLGAVTDFFPCSKMRCILLVLVSSAA